MTTGRRADTLRTASGVWTDPGEDGSRDTKAIVQSVVHFTFNCNAMSFDGWELILLFRSIVEDVIFGVSERKLEKKYKYSMKESINDNRLIDECIYADSGPSALFICHAIEHLASCVGGMRCWQYTLVQFNSNTTYNIKNCSTCT